MKYFIKMNSGSVVSFLCIAVLMMACTSDVDMLGNFSLDCGEQTARMLLYGGVNQFDGSTTRAGESAWEWADNAVIFIQFHTEGSNVVRGHAKYDKDEDCWDASFSGQLANSGTCEVYFFSGAPTSDKHKIPIVGTNAVYVTTEGSYSINNGCIVMDATLVPITSRLRFKGDSGVSIRVSGISCYSRYDADENGLDVSTDPVKLTVGSDGYTPYVYCVFEDAQKRQLNIVNSVDGSAVMFQKTFGSSVLKVGESGYLTIPTEDTNKGWSVIPQIPVTGVTLDKQSLSLDVGESVTLTATVTPSDASDNRVIWKTSNSSVATVENGVVTAVGYGTAIITVESAADASKNATCNVKVGLTDMIFNAGGVSFTMKPVKAGSFEMGSSSYSPVHMVTITKDYYIGETEVTQALWTAVTGYYPTQSGVSWTSGYGRGSNYPAYNISYNDVKSFLTQLNAMTGVTFRMPTEAEWEFAARGGTKSQGYTYSGSNTVSTVAWYSTYSSARTVKGKDANELGLYDMSGNVWEWCSDWYDSYSSYSQTDPTGPSSGSFRIVRGGDYNDSSSQCTVASRDYWSEGARYTYVGFRLALSK